MFAAFLGLGIALVLFGAVVLLRYSDRPGGTVKWMGLELSSAGAGLPLIALGVGCAIFAFAGPTDSASSTSELRQQGTTTAAGRSAASAASAAAPTGCAALAALAADRVDTVEAGTRDFDLVSPPQPVNQPFGIVFTDDGRPIGAMRMRLYPANGLFKIEALVDAACRPIEPLRNVSRGGNPRELLNWDTVRLRFGGHEYDLRIGGETGIRMNFTRLQ